MGSSGIEPESLRLRGGTLASLSYEPELVRFDQSAFASADDHLCTRATRTVDVALESWIHRGINPLDSNGSERTASLAALLCNVKSEHRSHFRTSSVELRQGGSDCLFGCADRILERVTGLEPVTSNLEG